MLLGVISKSITQIQKQDQLISSLKKSEKYVGNLNLPYDLIQKEMALILLTQTCFTVLLLAISEWQLHGALKEPCYLFGPQLCGGLFLS